jgi:O-antigen/teichoic acid export membrane protein
MPLMSFMSDLRARVIAFLSELRGRGPGAALVRGSATFLSIRALGLGLAFLTQITLARLLGVAEYGVYAYALSWLTVLAMLGAVGLDHSALRFVSEYRGREEWGLLRGFLRRSVGSALIASVGVALVAASVVLLLGPRLTPTEKSTFLIGSLLIPLMVQLQIGSATIRAFRKIAKAQLPADVVRPVLVVVTLMAIYLAAQNAVLAPTAMAATLLASVAALGVTAAYFRSTVRSSVPLVCAEYRSIEWLAVSFPMLILNGTYVLLSQTDILMIGMLLDTTEAGIYSAAGRLAMLLPLGLATINAIAAPMIAEFYAKDDRRRLQRTLTVAAWCAFGLALPLAIAIVFAGGWLLALYGPEFRIAYVSLLILSAGQIVNTITGPVGFVMTMTGHHKQAMVILILMIPVNLALNAALIPQFGIEGAAVATAATTVAHNILMLAYVRKHHRLNTTVFARTA